MKNKSGIASALISVLLIVSFFMPFTYYEGTSISTFKVISELASHGVLAPSWLFYIYIGLVVVNVFVQLINGNGALYSFVGGTGFGFIVVFYATFQSYDVEEGIFKVLNESPGFGVWISGLLALALVFVPQFFEDNEEKTEPANLDNQQHKESTMSELEALKEEAEELKSKLAQRKAEKEKDERERIEKEKLKEEIARLKKELGENEERI